MKALTGSSATKMYLIVLYPGRNVVTTGRGLDFLCSKCDVIFSFIWILQNLYFIYPV